MNVPGFPPSSWIPQAQRLDGPALSDSYVRQVGTEIARACRGRKIADPIIMDAMYPWDPEWARKDMARGQDHCALFVLMVLRAMGMGLPDDGIAEATRFGTVPLPPGRGAILDPMSRLRELPGWVPGNILPHEGCAVMIGRRNEPRSTHVMWVDHYGSGGVVESTDGGRHDVDKAIRRARQIGRELCLYDSTMGNRTVLGYVDPAKMRSMVVRDYCLPG